MHATFDTDLEAHELSLIRMCGLAARFPRAAARQKQPLMRLCRRGLRDLPGVQAAIEVAIDHGFTSQDALPTSYLLKRSLGPVTSHKQATNLPLIIREITEVQAAYATESVAALHLQDLMLETLGVLPPSHNDPALDLRARLAEANGIINQKPSDATKVRQPFRHLSDGKISPVNQLPRRPSGIPYLDNGPLEGGLVVGTTSTISGITNSGKTLFTHYLLRQRATLGGTPLLASVEDDFDLTYIRWIAFLLGMKQQDIEKKSDDEKASLLIEKYKDSPDQLAGIERTRFWCPDTASISDVIEKVTQTEAEEGIIITDVAVDYIQNMDVSAAAGNRQEQLAAEAARFITHIQTTKKTGFLVSQARKEAEEKSVKFLSLTDAAAECYAIMQKTKYGFTLFVEKKEADRLKLSKHDKRIKTNISLEKSKHSAKDGFFAIIDPARSTWHFFSTEYEREQVWKQQAND